jgi:hypothetical protein
MRPPPSAIGRSGAIESLLVENRRQNRMDQACAFSRQGNRQERVRHQSKMRRNARVAPIRLRRPPSSSADLNGREQHLSPDEMKHNFALQAINEIAFGSAREFLCHCVRCKWTFQVSSDHGTIVAFNNVGEPLDGAEANSAPRIRSLSTSCSDWMLLYHYGPC